MLAALKMFFFKHILGGWEIKQTIPPAEDLNGLTPEDLKAPQSKECLAREAVREMDRTITGRVYEAFVIPSDDDEDKIAV